MIIIIGNRYIEYRDFLQRLGVDWIVAQRMYPFVTEPDQLMAFARHTPFIFLQDFGDNHDSGLIFQTCYVRQFHNVDTILSAYD